MLTTNVLIAGATGYLGQHIVNEVAARGMTLKALVRSPKKLCQQKLSQQHILPEQIIQAEVTEPETLHGICINTDVVISVIGITRQTDKLSYDEVDYQGNLNLLREAKAAGVKKFIYVSVFRGEQLQDVAICRAKEKFVSELKLSGLEYCIIRPTGFFSDLSEIFHMAQKSKAYLFGDGGFRSNPIHGADLATVCVDAITTNVDEIAVGGPEVLSHKEMVDIAFDVLGKQARIRYIPEWIRKSALWSARHLTPKYASGPLEFFMTVMAMNMVAPTYGTQTLRAHFESLHSQPSSEPSR
ncbi:SDR family oxidoreductase [Vibrio sp. ZSDZ65]|uniref:SDR family oxidoreductase n=1 Tax=Vibrio qingdaonensis TaxID=2829491 RepID=A0A9X3CTQ7_9VIBR|nr:SDR family oxidoreductase [Vibrio qingdaonensis]MCW8348624.1 SDR family oxidoreductase [Vibrio qingdaonensis]